MRKDALSSNSKHYLRLAAVGTLVPFICIVLLPDGFLDGGPAFCPVRLLGGSWCPGCGMSRALWSLIHGNLPKAIALNWRVSLVAPLLVMHYIQLVSRWANTTAGWIEHHPAP
ncbi:MAG: hypothetical protein JWQ98_955 [Chlorobi bacterium]|nr:hypothetical protein [Chlorobiota bacterium]